MNHDDHAKLQALIQKAFRPPANAGLDRDLWPAMLRRLDRATGQPHPEWSWIDWMLGAAAAACLVVFPKAIPILLWHL